MNNEQSGRNKFFKSRKSVLNTKSYEFTVILLQTIRNNAQMRRDFALINQLIRSGSSVGALIRESEYAQSKPDFISKLSIALKESNECLYWLELYRDINLLDKNDFVNLHTKCSELTRMLISSINTAKKNLKT